MFLTQKTRKPSTNTTQRASIWIGTWNNPPMPAEDTLSSIHRMLTASHTKGQLEKGESGTPHLQFIINLGIQVRLTALKKHYPTIHWEATRSKAAEDYVVKEATRLEGPWELGKKPMNRASAKDWEAIRESAKEGKLDEVPADVYIRSYTTLKKIAEDHEQIPATLPDCRGILIYGPAGTGKTSYVRNLVRPEDLYLKGRNKWWDGYKG